MMRASCLWDTFSFMTLPLIFSLELYFVMTLVVKKKGKKHQYFMEIISILKAETACECLVSFCSPVSSYHSLLMMAKECGKICCEKTHHQIEKVEEKWRRWQ